MNHIFSARKPSIDPILFVLTLDRHKMTERILIGEELQIRRRLSNRENTKLIFDETRNLGHLLLDFGMDFKGKWYQGAINPLANALSLLNVLKADLENQALIFLLDKYDNGTALEKYAAIRIWDYYLQAKRARKKKEMREDFKALADLITLPFRRNNSFSVYNKAIPEESAKVHPSSRKVAWPYPSQARLDLWYPNNRNPVECASAYLSFDPLITYYFKRLEEWKLHFRQCKICDEYFLAGSKHYTLCSDKCRTIQRDRNKEKFDKQAKATDYEIAYTNASQNWRNKIRKAKATPDFPKDKLMTMESSFQDFKKVALKKKRAVKNQQANAKDFINWLLMQDNVVDGLLHSGLTSEKG